MTHPRFLADNDLMDGIVVGVRRREPTIVIVRVRDEGLIQAADSEVLAYAASEGLVLVSHDINTMRAAAVMRIENSEPMAGLLLVHQRDPIAQTIDDLVLIGLATEAEDWIGQIQFLPL